MCSDTLYHVVSYLPIIDKYNLKVAMPLPAICRVLYDQTDTKAVDAICEVKDEARITLIASNLAYTINSKNVMKLTEHCWTHKMSNTSANILSIHFPNCSYSFAYDMFCLAIRNNIRRTNIANDILDYISQSLSSLNPNSGILERLIRTHVGEKPALYDNLVRIIKEFYQEPDRKQRLIKVIVDLAVHTHNPKAYIKLLSDKVVCNGDFNHVIEYRGITASVASWILPTIPIELMYSMDIKTIQYYPARLGLASLWRGGNIEMLRAVELKFSDVIDLHYATDCKYPWLLIQLSQIYSIVTIWDAIDKLEPSVRREVCDILDLPCSC